MGAAGIRLELRHVLRKHIASALAYRLVMVLLSLPLLPFMLIEKLFRPAESSWSWWVSAYLKGRRLARHRDFDLIYSTGGAYSTPYSTNALHKDIGTRSVVGAQYPFVMLVQQPGTPQKGR